MELVALSTYPPPSATCLPTAPVLLRTTASHHPRLCPGALGPFPRKFPNLLARNGCRNVRETVAPCRVVSWRYGRAERGRGVGGTRSRAAAWLAWSLAALSLALLVGGIALLPRDVCRSGPPIRRRGERWQRRSRPGYAARLLGRGRHHRLPPPPQHHRMALLRHGRDDRSRSFAGDYAEFWLASGFGPRSLARRRPGSVVVVDPPGLCPYELRAAVVP